MSILSRLLSRLTGGAESDQSAVTETPPEGDERTGSDTEIRSADPPTEPMGSARVADATTTMQSHGSHWDTVLPDDGSGANVQEVVMQTVSEGAAAVGVEHDGMDVVGYAAGDGAVQTVAVTLDGGIATAYPHVEGITHEFSSQELNEWESGIEAWVGGNLGPASVTAFATNYFERPAGEFGGDRSVSLSLLAYDFGPSDYDTVVGEDGEELDVSDFVGFRPWERGAPDDYVVRTKVTDVSRVEDEPVSGHLLRVPLFRSEEGVEFDVNCFVADHVAGEYVPTVGDTVEGACWLQATFE